MKLLVTTRWDPHQLESVRAAFPQVEFVTAITSAEMASAIVDAEVVFGRIDRPAFLAAKQLKWIQSQGAGVETMADIPELIGSPVIVTNTRGAHAQTIAEHAFGMLLYMTRQFEQLVAAQKASTWAGAIKPAQVGLSGMTLGIVGLGNIGRAIAKRGWAFDMEVVAVDINDVAKPDYVAQVHRLDWLPELMQQSDVVAVSAPFTPQTEGLLSADMLALMQPSAYLLVVSRGGIIDEAALSGMLRAGKLAGAALDVTSVEPLPASSELWNTPNLFLSPHCSGRSTQTTSLATGIFRDNLARYLAGQPLTNLVDISRGF